MESQKPEKKPSDQRIKDLVACEILTILTELLKLNDGIDIKSRGLRIRLIQKLKLDLDELGVL